MCVSCADCLHRFFFEALPRVVRMHLPDNTRVLRGGGSSSAIQHDRRKPGLLSKMLNVTKYKRQRIKQQVSSIQVRTLSTRIIAADVSRVTHDVRTFGLRVVLWVLLGLYFV